MIEQIMPEVHFVEITTNTLDELGETKSMKWLIERFIGSQKIKKGSKKIFLLRWNCVHKMISSVSTKKFPQSEKHTQTPSFEGVVKNFLEKHSKYASWEILYNNRGDKSDQQAALVYAPIKV